VDTLRELGSAAGFTVDAVDVGRAQDQPTPFSSTAVRAALANGDVRRAAAILGRPHAVEGVVVHGDHRGRELGYPTANLAPDPPNAAIPADGVYGGWLVRADGERLSSAISVGTNPTFDGTGRRVEAHVLDRDGADPSGLDLYGEQVTVEFVGRLRAMVRFDSVDQLVEQMAEDVQQARTLLG
jgi:riboflavin kinase/FMN adenylyltransferase